MQPIPVLIIGASGSGKSSSIATLDSEETFLFNVCQKDLPFRGGSKKYTEINSNDVTKGNKKNTDDYKNIKGWIKLIEKERPEIKNYVVDDSHYLIVNEFMRKCLNRCKGNEAFQVYNELAYNFWDLIYSSRKTLADEKFIFFLHHSEINEQGNVVPKTIGKMLNEKIDISGMFTTVLYAKREETKNFFYTQNDGTTPAKSPAGMFTDTKIPNDLQLVKNTITTFYEGEYDV